MLPELKCLCNWKIYVYAANFHGSEWKIWHNFSIFIQSPLISQCLCSSFINKDFVECEQGGSTASRLDVLKTQAWLSEQPGAVWDPSSVRVTGSQRVGGCLGGLGGSKSVNTSLICMDKVTVISGDSESLWATEQRKESLRFSPISLSNPDIKPLWPSRKLPLRSSSASASAS